MDIEKVDDVSLSPNTNTNPRYSDISCIDISNWWTEFTSVLRFCYTPNRADLEIPSVNMENFQEWAYSAASELMANSDIVCRDKVIAFICGSNLGIRILMMYMEELSSSGSTKAEVLSRVLREMANPKNGTRKSKKRVRHLKSRFRKYRHSALRLAVEHEYEVVSVQVLKDLLYIRSKTKGQAPFETIERTIINILWFLSAVAANDSGFASKIRQMLKVKFFHHDLLKKMFFGRKTATVHYPLLKILRQLSKTGSTSHILGKDGIMSTIRKMFSTLSNQPGGKLLLLVDSVLHLTKDKSNSVRFLKAGLLIKMMHCFSSWQLWRGRGLLKLSKSVIIIYNHVGKTKQGRKALLQCDAIPRMRKFFDECPMDRSFDDVVMKGVAMLANSYEEDKLPLNDIESPIKFEIPDAYNPSKFNDSGSSSDDEGSESEEEEDVAKSEEVPIDEDDSSEDDRSISDEEDSCLKLSNESSKTSSSLNKQDSTVASSSSRSRRDSNKTFEESTPKAPGPIPVEKLIYYSGFFQEFKVERSEGTEVSFQAEGPRICSSDSEIDENFNETIKSLKIPTSEHNYSWIKDRPEGKFWSSINDMKHLYAKAANEVNSVAPFVKIAYPEFSFGYSLKSSENILPTADRATLRSKLIAYSAKVSRIESYRPKVMYCLDDLMQKTSKGSLPPGTKLGNLDEKDVGNFDRKIGLQFESRFESGNLRKAIQVAEKEYDLVITSDINSCHHNQWFYFQISNICDDGPYTFNIINCTKTNSLFNYGMQPVVFSVTDAMKGAPGWVRSGSKICYYKNGYKCVTKKNLKSSKVYHTLSFNLTFSHKGDIVYVAYHIPYTYTRLMVELNTMMKAVEESKTDRFVRYDTLCQSLNNNEVPVLTVTSQNESKNPMKKRKIIFLTSRVHPGESNASWVMKGILEYLFLNSKSIDLLKKYVFKIVPMLNVEGVINGCHRCGLTNEDLNRCWKYPSEILHPTIYHSKMLIEYSCRILNNPPVAYIDLHGHSRRKNLFFYGCSFAKSWNNQDQNGDEDNDLESLLKSLPERMARFSSAFCLTYCNYDVRKSRETTARVAVWRDYQIVRSYTLECSYCGCDRGSLKGVAFGTNQLLDMGKNLCQALESL